MRLLFYFIFTIWTSLLFSQFSNSLVEFSRRESYEIVAPNLVDGHIYGHSLKLWWREEATNCIALIISEIA